MGKKLPVSELAEGMIVEEGIYVSGDVRVPLIAKNAVLTNFLIEKIKSNGVKEVKVNAENKQSRLLDVVKPPPVLNPRLRQDVLNNLEEMFSLAIQDNQDGQDGQSGQSVRRGGGSRGKPAPDSKAVKQLDTVVGQMVSAIAMDRHTTVNINDLKSYDEYTYHHSLSVSVLSIAMAQHLGFDKGKLNQTGKCAIMHDIGKTAIPIQIINKTSRLDAEEFRIVQNHSVEGFKYLAGKGIGNEALWQGVMYHHEKYDGTGYPSGLAKEEIPLLSRIISVADVYDALTSNRPYRRPMQPAEALEYVMAGVSTFFDYDVVRAFMDKMEPYPIGCLVELSNGKIAVVVNNEFPLRPVVQCLDSGDILDLYNDRRCLTLLIRQVYPDPPK